MTLTSETIEMVGKLHDILNRGHYPDIKVVANTYNEVFPNKKPITANNCGSCNRKRVLDMVKEVDRINKLILEENGNETTENPINGKEEKNAISKS